MNPIQLEKNILLSNFTTWRIGGPAEWIAQPKNIEEIKYLINWLNQKKIPCNIMGAGDINMVSANLFLELIDNESIRSDLAA